MTFIYTIIAIIFLCAVGYWTITFFSLLKMTSRVEKLGYAYGLGGGLVCLQMFFYSQLSIQWSWQSILLPWIFLILATVFLINKRKILGEYAVPQYDWQEKILILFLFITCVYVLINVVLRPVSGWDAVATWFMGGKAFYFDGFLNPSLYGYFDHDSPPFMSLLVSFGNIIIGKADDKAILLLFTFYYFSLLAIFYFTVKRFSQRKFALLFTFLLAVTNSLIRQAARFDVGYVDLPLAYYFFSSVVILIHYVKVNSWKDLILLNIFIGTGALIKNEGMPFFFIVQFVTLSIIFIRKDYKRVLLLFTGFLFIGNWWMFRYIYHIQQNYLLGRNIDIYRLPTIVLESTRELLQIQRWNLLWVVFVIAFFISRKKLKLPWLILILCSMQLCVYIYIYFITPIDPALHINNSFDRLLLHIAPIAMLYIAITFSSILFEKRNYKITFQKKKKYHKKSTSNISR